MKRLAKIADRVAGWLIVGACALGLALVAFVILSPLLLPALGVVAIMKWLFA